MRDKKMNGFDDKMAFLIEQHFLPILREYFNANQNRFMGKERSKKGPATLQLSIPDLCA